MPVCQCTLLHLEKSDQACLLVAEVPDYLQVAKKLVALHDDLMHQQTGLLQALRAAVPSGASSSRRQQVSPRAAIKDAQGLGCGTSDVSLWALCLSMTEMAMLR